MSQILKSFKRWMNFDAEIFQQKNIYDKTTGRTSPKKVSRGTFKTYFYERRANELYRGGAFKTEQLKSTVDAVFIFDPVILRNSGIEEIADSDKITFKGRDYSVVHSNNVGFRDEVMEVIVKRINNG